MNRHVLPWRSSDSQNRFLNASAREIFFWLTPYFAPQRHPNSCALASAACVLNAMRGCNEAGDFITEEELAAKYNLHQKPVGTGYTLAEVGCIFNDYKLVSKVLHCNGDVPAAETILVALASGACVVANYDRRVLGQPGKGHFSPVAAYHAPSRSFLLMDTRSPRYDWQWVDSDVLASAMHTRDGMQFRGFIVVQGLRRRDHTIL